MIWWSVATLAVLFYVAYKVDRLGVKEIKPKTADRIRWLAQVRGREAELIEWMTVLGAMELKGDHGLSDFYMRRNAVRWAIRQELAAIELWVTSGLKDEEMSGIIDNLSIETGEAISNFREEYRDEDE